MLTASPLAEGRMRSRVARDFLEALAADLLRRHDPALAPFTAALAGLDPGTPQPARGAAPGLAALGNLGPLLASAMGDPAMVTATRAAAPLLDWYRIYQGAGMDPALAEGMLAGQVVGQAGIFGAERFRAGLFLLGPGIHYPLHTHAAAEVYYGLAGRLTLRHGLDGAAFDVTPGGYSVTPPHRLHSLTTGERPVLLAYLWAGEVDAPIWVWENQPGRGRQRVNWARQPDGSWARARVEPVGPEAMREAGA